MGRVLEGLGDFNNVFGAISTGLSIVGLIPGVDIPDELAAIFGGGGPDYGPVLAEINTKLDQVLAQGEEIRQQINDTASQSLLTNVNADKNTARNAFDRYLITGDPLDAETALTKSDDALSLVVEYCKNPAANLAIATSTMLAVLATRVAVIKELGDGATSGEYRTELQGAIDTFLSTIEPLRQKIVQNDRMVYVSTDGPEYRDSYESGYFYDRRTTFYWVGLDGGIIDANNDGFNDFFLGETNHKLIVGSSNNPYPGTGILDTQAQFNDAYQYMDAHVVHIRTNRDEIYADYLEHLYESSGLNDLEKSLEFLGRLTSGQYVRGQDGPVNESITFDGSIGSNPNDSPHTLEGRGGGDTLTGGDGDDALRGGGGPASDYGSLGDGHDKLYGKGGKDVLIGGTGNDTLDGGSGNDRVNGGQGSDWASYASAPAGVTVSLLLSGWQNTVGDGFDKLISIENLEGSDHDDRLTGNSDGNVLIGRAGNDVLDGGAGNDVLHGGAGADTVFGGGGNDTADFADHATGILVTLSASFSIVSVQNGSGGFDEQDTLIDIEHIIGGSGNDAITGNTLDNRLTGGAGADVLKGGDGADTLFGDTTNPAAVDGADTLEGGSGQDRFELVSAGGAMDRLTGGTGRDIFVLRAIKGSAADVITDFQAGFSGDYVDLSAYLPGGADGFAGGYFRLIQLGANTQLQMQFDQGGVLAYQTIVTLSGVAAGAFAEVNFVSSTLTPTGRFTQKAWENHGTAGHDTLIGTNYAETVLGFGGNDVLRGLLGKDVLDGGVGADWADFRDKSAAVSVTLSGSTNAAATVGGVAEDTLRNIENLLGGSGADTLTGDGLSNVLRGGAGQDKLDGGAGIDMADFTDKTTSVVLALNGTTFVTAMVGGAAEDTLRNIENVSGGTANDTLIGDGFANLLSGNLGNDALRGGLGRDVLDGGAGQDTASFADKSAAVVVALNGAIAVTASVGGVAEDTLRNIENLVGGSGADTLTGDVFANSLLGNGGDDKLRGGLGRDVLNGAAGIDTADYADKTAAVVVTLNGATAVTATVGGVAEDALLNVENLVGGSGNDTLTGDGASNTLSGGLGRDVLDGRAGVDTVDYSDQTMSISVGLNGSSDASVSVGGVAEDTLRNVENLNGGSGNDTLFGDGAANVLSGGAGNDVLRAGGSADILIGGDGSDTADYSDAVEGMRIDIQYDWTHPEQSYVGDDVLIGIENLTGGSGDDEVYGNDSANVLDGGGGADAYLGGQGADTFVFKRGEIVNDFVDYTSQDTIRLIGYNPNKTQVGVGTIGSRSVIDIMYEDESTEPDEYGTPGYINEVIYSSTEIDMFNLRYEFA